MAGGRWDPRLRGAAYTPDETPDVDNDPPEVHIREQLEITRRRLETTHEDSLERPRLQRDLEEWQRQLAALERDQHWSSGEGDRTLF